MVVAGGKLTIEPGVDPSGDPRDLPAAAVSAPELAVPGFGDLYRQSYADMVRLARVLVGPAAAEDLVQDVFVRVHRQWGRVREPRLYLRRSVVNACRSHHRRAWRERPGHRPSESGGSIGSDTRSDDLEVVDGRVEEARSDDAGILLAALATLSHRQRSALVLRYYQDLSDADIADALGCRIGTVASLVHRGLEALRKVVDDGQ